MSHLPRKLKGSLVTAFLSGILTVLGYFVVLNGAFDSYQHIAGNFLQKKVEDNSHVTYTGASIKYIGSIFGPPVKEEYSEDGRVHGHIYSFKKSHLQVAYDNNNTVTLYSVTSKDENFHPEAPYLRRTLGYRFRDFGSDIDYLQSSYLSKSY